MSETVALFRPREVDVHAAQRGKRTSWSRFGLDAIALHSGLLCVCAAFAAPFAWMILTGLKSARQTAEYPPHVLPHPPQPGNFLDLLRNPDFDVQTFTRNTFTLAVLTALGTTVSSALVGYGFARFRFRGRGLLFGFMLATIMVPYPVLMVPTFRLFRWFDDMTGAVFGPGTVLQMMGTNKPLWVPAWFGNAFSIFLLRQFFLSQPKDLAEAAQLDGCGEFGIFWRIAVPLARPALLVVALFAFLGTWNDFLGPLIYLQEPRQYTLGLGLQAFQTRQGGTEWNLLMAAATLVCLPTTLLFFATQRHLIRGVAFRGAK